MRSLFVCISRALVPDHETPKKNARAFFCLILIIFLDVSVDLLAFYEMWHFVNIAEPDMYVL